MKELEEIRNDILLLRNLGNIPKEVEMVLLRKLNTVEQQLKLYSVSQQRELLLAYHKHLDSFNDPTIYNASETMIDDYLDNNCG